MFKDAESAPVRVRSITTAAVALSAALAWACTQAKDEAKTVYRILCLGDSITHAESNRASYRYPLWKKFIDAGIAVDFVGSMTNQRGGDVPPHDDYKGQQFDKDHEGHFAWRADEIINGRNFDNGTGMGSLADWQQHYDADIVLMHLGTNDAFHAQSNESTGEELKTLIATLREDNPKVAVLVAKLIPTSRSPKDAAAVASLNEYIPSVVEQVNTAESPVVLVDMFTDFDPVNELYDGVHPNAEGEEKMAQRWFDAVMKVIDGEA